MASGQVHTAVTLGATAGLGGGFALGYFTHDPTIVLLVGCGIIAGVFIGPDLDVDGGNISEYHIRKLLKVTFLWSAFWRPYRLALRHRSFWSHGPIVSTVIRIAYIFSPPVIFIVKDQDTSWLTLFFHVCISQLLALPFVWLLLTYTEILITYIPYLFLGLLVSDILHLIFDR